MESKSVGNVFLKHLPYIQTVIFSSWVYFGSVQKTTVRFSDGQAIYDTETLISPSDSSHTPQAVMPKSEFLTRLRKIRIEHWYREYIDLPFWTENSGSWKSAFRMAGHLCSFMAAMPIPRVSTACGSS